MLKFVSKFQVQGMLFRIFILSEKMCERNLNVGMVCTVYYHVDIVILRIVTIVTNHTVSL